MFFARSHADLHNIRLGVERIKNVSDRIVGVGPIGIGLDGILSWIPGAGVAYSGIAGAMLVAEGIRARAATGTLIHMAALLFVDTFLDVVPNPVFGRSVPVQWWNYPALAVTAVLGGIVLATYAGAAPRERVPGDGSRLGAFGGVMSFLAVGCPACNKLALLLLGASGALTYWAPLQPLVAVASVVSLAVAAVRRLAGEIACPTRRPAK